jgi:hypothetical protein
VQQQESALLWHQKWEPKSWKICEIIRIQKQQPSYLLSFLHNHQPIKKTLLNTDLGDMPIPKFQNSSCMTFKMWRELLSKHKNKWQTDLL